MSFISFIVAGTGFALVGAGDAFTIRNGLYAVPLRPSRPTIFTFFASFLLSLLFILNASLSAVGSLTASDDVGLPLHLQTVAVAILFLIYSLTGILNLKASSLLPLPGPILDLLALFAFAEEFLLFYLQRTDPGGLENRYYDLLLVPISLCALSTVLAIRSPQAPFPCLGRAVGLILQGTWFVQMGFSFHTNLMAHGCALHQRTGGIYTITCKTLLDVHRGMGISTLQFNCHLAVLVLLVVVMYIGSTWDLAGGNLTYWPLREQMGFIESRGNFTLCSDEVDQLTVEENGPKNTSEISLRRINGFSYQ